MKIFYNKILLLVFFSLLFGKWMYLPVGNQVFAQTKKIEIIHANSFEFDEKLGKNVKRLIGNVKFKHEGILMFCDSAYFYPNNSLDAFGNIHIQQGDTINITGQLLKYDGNTRKAELQKNIRLIDKDMTLTTDLLFYDLSSSSSTYYNGGTIISKQNTLTSERGYYFPKNKEFSFCKKVVLTNPEYVMNCDTLLYNTNTKIAFFYGPSKIKNNENLIYCENGWYDTDKNISQFSKNSYLITRGQKLKSDSLLYDKKKGIGKAFGNVMIIDTSENVMITGNKAMYMEQIENSIITGNILLKQYYNSDTLFLHADTLRTVYEHPIKRNEKTGKYIKDTAETWKVLYAYHKVKFFKDDLQGKCDSLVYSYKDSTMRLFREPVLWSEENQLTAEKINIKISNGEIKKLFLKNTAFIISKVEIEERNTDSSIIKNSSKRFDQIKGKEMTGYFHENKLRKIKVEGNGQTIYYAKDKIGLIGVNKADCSDLLIHIKENKVDKIIFFNKPDATLYPINELSINELLLKDFVWKINERPKQKEDIFH
ncbi:MAG: OstA-like protein [Bacteroidota bacterium]